MSDLPTNQELLQTAVSLHQAGRLAEAEAAYRRVLANDPARADALHLLGALTSQRGKHDAAVELIQRAIAARPGVAEYYANLGMIHRQRGKWHDAAASFRQALALRADLPPVWFSLANALQKTGRFDEAIEAYQRGLALKPDEAEAFVGMSVLLSERGRTHDAVSALESAIRIKPDHAEAHWRLSQSLLVLGRFEEAWPHAEWEARVSFLPRGPRFPKPQWDGSDLQGKTILLHTTQGIGDTIQFIRYVPLVAERGARVVLLSHQPRLLKLLKGFPGVERIITEAWEQPQYDVHCPLLVLPRLFRTTLNSIPSANSYFKADAQLAADWAARLSAHSPAGRRVGLVWAGNPDHYNDRNRSMPLAALSPLKDVPGMTFFSLQKGQPAKQIHEPTTALKPIDVAGELNDFADTAALIANLDLLITVDTSVAHLAGALGKPVWTLLPFVPDWRWMLDRSDTPWYPSMRLFRQHAIGDWSGVVADVERSLPQII